MCAIHYYCTCIYMYYNKHIYVLQVAGAVLSAAAVLVVVLTLLARSPGYPGNTR